MIGRSIVVTAGHCVWNHDPLSGGPLVECKVYAGYQGRNSTYFPSVEMRKVVEVTTSARYVANQSQRAYDAAFLTIEQPFDQVTPMSWESTPASGTGKLGVVGYPGDKIDEVTKERGARMFEMYLQTTWDLKSAEHMMLAYMIDTFGGELINLIQVFCSLICITRQFRLACSLGQGREAFQHRHPYLWWISEFCHGHWPLRCVLLWISIVEAIRHWMARLPGG